MYFYKDNIALSRLIIGFLVLGILLRLVPSIFYIFIWLLDSPMGDILYLNGTFSALITLGFSLAKFLFNIALLIMVSVWIYRSAENAWAICPENMRYSPGWTLGWFFIPVVNLWKPYGGMVDIYRTCVSEGEEELYMPALLPLWWGLWVIFLFTPLYSLIIPFVLFVGLHFDYAYLGYMSMLLTVLSVFLFIAFAVIVREVTYRQTVAAEKILGIQPAYSQSDTFMDGNLSE